MTDSGLARPLTGWQRAYVLWAAQYVRELIVSTPRDERARAVYEGLLEVLEPTRHVARQYREQHPASRRSGSMWEQRSSGDRRVSDRRTIEVTPAGGERRRAQRRSGHDRRASRA